VRFSPSCGCCAAVSDCDYVASDGSEYSDTFDSADSGWLVDVDAENTFSVSGGHALLDWDSGGQFNDHELYRVREIVTMVDFYVILETEIYWPTDADSTGIFWADRTLVSIFARWDLGDFAIIYNGALTPIEDIAPDVGDKLTIKMFRVGTSGGLALIHYCFFVNEQLVAEAEGTADYTGDDPALRYGLFCIPSSTTPGVLVGEWDDFTIQIGA